MHVALCTLLCVAPAMQRNERVLQKTNHVIMNLFLYMISTLVDYSSSYQCTSKEKCTTIMRVGQAYKNILYLKYSPHFYNPGTLMFNFIKNALKSLYSTITSPLQGLFSRATIDQDTIKELEKILIEADTGITTTKHIIATVQQAARSGALANGNDLRTLLHAELLRLLSNTPFTATSPVYLLVGINGSGKTTVVSKLAYLHASQGKRVLLVAADTFRAAAQEQLNQWAQSINVDIVVGSPNQDPAAVVFEGCRKFLAEKYDVVIIDTAGRLQTKINLMKELEKIRRVINKHLPNQPITTLLTVDSMLGQNSFEQAKLFHESTPLDGIVLTKMDGTGKGGIVFSITQALHIPIAFISFGEQKTAFAPFQAKAYVDSIIGIQ